MRKRTFATVAFGSTLALLTTSAFADVAAPVGKDAVSLTTAASVISVASGANRGRLDGEMKFRYPGFEQTSVVLSKNHLVLITMEAVLEKGKAPVQCSCSSYEMRADGAPRLVTDLKRLSDYPSGNDRACNHPKAAADENGNIVWGYGSDYNNNRPNTYAGIINEKCEVLSAPQMVSIPRNANDGAFDISYVGKGLFVAAYYSDGGNGPGFPLEGGDYAVAMGLQVNQGSSVLPTLSRTWIQPAIMGGAIMRPSVAVMSDSRVLIAASQGGNRPSVNTEVALLDTQNGTKVFSAPISKGDPGKMIYFNSPTIKKLSPDPADRRAVMLDWESNGMGKGTNIKGTSKTHLYMLELNGDSVNVVSETTDVGAHQTHASLCTGAYGDKGDRTAGIFTAAPTGIGRATMSMFAYNDTRSFSHDPKTDAWPAAWYGDSGHLANWYGANPMRQGRDFMWCIGDVPNLGYHVAGGFMPDVKSLFVGTVHGRVPGDAKNSLFLSMIPGQMDKKPSPTNPVPAGEAPVLDPNAVTDGPGATPEAGGCGCSTPGQTSRGPAGALIGLVALGLVVAARRRKS